MKTSVKENFSNRSHGLQPCLTQWNYEPCPVQFSSVPELCPTLCDPMDWSTPGSLFITNSWNLLKLMYIKVVMPSNHLILCCPLLLKPSIFPSIRVFSDDSVLLFWQSLFLKIVIRVTLMAYTVKSLLTKWETQIRSWGSFSRKREWLPPAVFLHGDFYGQRSLEDYSPWGHK